MDDLFYCIRIMQISTDKLQSTRNSECLRRSSLIRTTFLQSRKHFCDLIHSLIKISSTTNALQPVIIMDNNHDIQTKLYSYQPRITSQKKRKSCHVDAGKRLCLTSSSAESSSSSSSNVSNEITSDS